MRLFLPVVALLARARNGAPAKSGEAKWALLAASVILAGFLLRLAYALAPHVAFADEPYYLWLAKSLFAGEGYSYYAGRPELHLPPLFPIVLGMLHWIVPDWEVVSRVAYV